MFRGFHLEKYQEGWQKLKMKKETLLSRLGAKAGILSALRMIQYNSDELLDEKELYSEEFTFKDKRSKDQGEEKTINVGDTVFCKLKDDNEQNDSKYSNITVSCRPEICSVVTDSFNTSICKLEQVLLRAIQESKEEILTSVSEKIKSKVDAILEEKFVEFSDVEKLNHNVNNDCSKTESNEKNEETEGEKKIMAGLIELEQMEEFQMSEDRPEPKIPFDTQLFQTKLKELKKENENCQAQLLILNKN